MTSAVVLRSCADLLSSVPYLLGFHPVDSVVVVAFRGRRARFAARSDLPGSAPDVPPPGAVAARFVALLARERVDAVALVGYGAPALVTPALDALRGALAGTRIAELDVLRVEGGRYWSYVCLEPSCCPPSGVVFDPAAPAAVAAVVAGRVALPDRASLVRAIAPVEGSARASMRVATERAWRRLDDLLDARTAGVTLAAFTPPAPTPVADGGVGEEAEGASAGLAPGLTHPATTRTPADHAPARSARAAVDGVPLQIEPGVPRVGSVPGAVDGGPVADDGSGDVSESGSVERPATVTRPAGEGASVGAAEPPVELPSIREVVGRHAGRPARGRSAHQAISVRQRRLIFVAGRVAVAEALAHHAAGRALPDDDVAWLSVLLTHVPVRDHAWEHTDDDERHVALWSDVVRRVDPILAAAPAGLLAFAAWRSGHGALAAAAVDRALSADPEYPMALLMEEVLDQCVAPSAWSGRPASRARRRRRGRARRERETP
jgi:hypothetical protein